MNQIMRLADYSWQKVFVIAFALCAAYYFLQYDHGESLVTAMNQKQTDLANEQQLLAKTKEAMRDLERFKEELNNQQAQVREVLSFLPKQMNVAELVSTIQDRANQSGMRVLKTEPKDTLEKVEFYESMKIDIQLQGTYAQIATFLSLLSKLPRLVTIESIQLATQPGEPENPKIDFKATLIGYRFAGETKKEGENPQQAGTPSGQPQ